MALSLCTWLVLTQTAGCYTRTSVAGAGAPGTVLVVSLNDRGRAQVEPSVGPNVERLEGRVLSASDSTVALAMLRSRAFGGDETRWTGERVELRLSGARSLERRTLARTRTYLLIGAVVAAVAGIVLTRSLSTSGQPDRDPIPLPPNGS